MTAPTGAQIHPTERADASRHGATDVDRFVLRQRAARRRVALLADFYRAWPCRTGALHQLATAGIALARFAAMSEAYAAIGERLMPVDEDGRPRGPLWEAYVRSHDERLPEDVREERWLAAHVADMERVRAEGWVARFEEEEAAHRGDPTWAMLAEHMSVTLGARVQDREALMGRVALETAMSGAISTAVRRQAQTGAGLVQTYVLAAVRAVLRGGPIVPDGLPSDRQLVGVLIGATLRLARVTRVWRLGVRRRGRGAEGQDRAWSLIPSLRAVLGDELDRVHPSVHQLFDRMDAWRMTARVRLRNRLSLAAARFATLLVGQGMYESHLEDVDARFRLFRRDDGSLHFVREFWCDDAVRVFDSDFVVREVDGRPVLMEIFQELGVAARMRTEVLDDGGIAMTVVGLFVRGIPRSVGPFRVCFTTRPGPDGSVDVAGVLDVRPRSRLERLWLRFLGVPDRVGEIRYLAVPASPSGIVYDKVRMGIPANQNP